MLGGGGANWLLSDGYRQVVLRLLGTVRGWAAVSILLKKYLISWTLALDRRLIVV